MADYRVPISQPFDVAFNARESGIAAQIEYLVNDNDGNTVIGPVGGLTEISTSGVYVGQITAPGTEGGWTIVFSKDGSFAPETNSIDSLVTYDPGVTAPDVPPLTPIAEDGAQAVGPCQAWTTADLAAECCGAVEDGSDTTPLEDPVVAASQILYRLSNNQFPGTCTARVRPCGVNQCAGPWQNWQGWGWLPVNRDLGVYGSWGSIGDGCGCQPLSRVPLAGGAREILEVTIDGAIVDAATYRLDERRYLTRVPDPADPDTRLSWPACQDMSLPETDEGTFSILYTYGQDPPVAGILAAQELACAIHQTCAGGGSTEECALPTGVVEIQRQGITIKLDGFRSWGYDPVKRVWKTGLPLTDLFLNTYAPLGQQPRARVWSPGKRRLPRPVAGAS